MLKVAGFLAFATIMALAYLILMGGAKLRERNEERRQLGDYPHYPEDDKRQRKFW